MKQLKPTKIEKLVEDDKKMEEYLQFINATAERIYLMTLNKCTLSREELGVLKAEISSMMDDVEEAQNVEEAQK